MSPWKKTTGKASRSETSGSSQKTKEVDILKATYENTYGIV
jgi:hypothetical protein